MTETPTITTFGETVRIGASVVHISGHLELQNVDGAIRPVRIPQRYWSHFPPHSAHVRATTTRPAGVRLTLTTASTVVNLRVKCTRLKVADILAEENSFVARVDGREIAIVKSPTDAIEMTSLTGDDLGTEDIRESSLLEFSGLPAGEKTVEILLPQIMMVDLVDVYGNQPIEPGTPPARPVWIHHGSSISHGSEPDKPTAPWPLVAADYAGLNVINLGFAGQCMLDPFVADAIAATPADVITLKIGINIVGARAMDQRTFVPGVHGFIDRIRVGHPTTPIVVASSLLWPGNEDRPGPTAREDLPGGAYRFKALGTEADIATGALSLAISRDHLRHVVEVRQSEGEAIHYLDGQLLYGEADTATYSMPDGLHPDATLYREVGRRFAEYVFGEGGLIPITPRETLDR
ncbi:SGNH/GDSL hydrolase family protein [Microbacterium pumilum]|uniref:SGNH/GDSL hydrolase family protein n=1 Tax=Microbacterium pumilum TaxID=344165 RepID=A0ABN2T2E9_9MICO